MKRLKWYAARLAAMSPPEVAHRLREAVAKRAYARNRLGWDNVAAVGDAGLPELGRLRQRLAGAAEVAPAQHAASLAALGRGVYAGLGHEVPAADASVWFRDPVSGTAWPDAAYCFDIDVRSTGETRGDVKFVWETNRLQMLHPLCAEVAAGRADKAALLAVLRQWAAANPPYRGVNWFSGIELAMRMVTFTLVVAAADWAGEERIFLRRLIAAHGYWLARYPSRFSSANNHRVAEGLGLLLAGLLMPDLPHATFWSKEGRHIVETEAGLQIFADGVGAEQSPTYQAFTMEMLAFATLVMAEAGTPLAPGVMARLRSGAVFLRALMDTAGHPPRIGDDDEGRVLAAPPDREPRYVASIVAAVAGLAGDAALLPPARDPHLRDALFAVSGGAGHAADGAHTFAQGGYSVLRRALAGRQAVLTFDHGPLGYLTLAAHGHADALALWLSLDDQPVFVDAGTYLYHSGGALRDALRSTPAHNTVTVAGQSQAVPSSPFSWKNRPEARLEPGAGEAVSASHDGYLKRFGVRHHRSIVPSARGFTIADALSGAAAPMPVEIGFLLHPALSVTAAGSVLTIARQGQPVARLTAPPGFTTAIVRDEQVRGRGLYSPAFGRAAPSDQIIFAGVLGDTAAITTIEIIEP